MGMGLGAEVWLSTATFEADMKTFFDLLGSKAVLDFKKGLSEQEQTYFEKDFLEITLEASFYRLRNRLRADIRRFEGESSGEDDGEELFGSNRI